MHVNATPRVFSMRNVALTLLALILIAAMVMLGLWQLGVYTTHQHEDAAAALKRAPVPIDDLLGPDSAFPGEAVSRPVTVVGSYVPDDQFYVRGLSGTDRKFAVVTPLLTSTGSSVLVVRGGTDDPGSSATAPPSGQVQITGVLEPSQQAGANLSTDRVTDGIRISSLVAAMSDDLYAGYVIATRSSPGDTLPPVTPPSGTASRWAGIRNLLYAFQWWVFAGFVVFMWWRIVTDDRREAAAG